MKLRRTIATLAAGGTAAAAVVMGAGAASAATPQLFCVNGTSVCAQPQGSSPVKMPLYTVTNRWLYNGDTHGPGQIQQYNADLCMQLDHAGGNVVIEAKCNGASYQSWQAEYAGANNGDDVFVSEWDPTMCLTYNESQSYLDVVTCNYQWYQEFGSATQGS